MIKFVKILDLQKQTLLWMVPTKRGKKAFDGSTAGGLISMFCGMVIVAIVAVKTEQMVSGQNYQVSSTLDFLNLSEPLNFNSLGFMSMIEVFEFYPNKFLEFGLRNNETGEWVEGEIEKYVSFFLTTKYYMEK